MSLPTLVIIPGSFSPPALYKNLVENLQSLGFETIVEPLQSAIRKDPSPSSSMYDDASYFHDVIARLADQGKDVVLLPHSYGGIVANESAKGLLKSERSEIGKTGGIIEILNISTLSPAVGESALDVAGELGLDQFPVQVGKSIISIVPQNSLSNSIRENTWFSMMKAVPRQTTTMCHGSRRWNSLDSTAIIRRRASRMNLLMLPICIYQFLGSSVNRMEHFLLPFKERPLT